VVELKMIDYRGGLVRFAIPATWLEEYEPEGGGTFYLDAPGSGTLRLNVLTFEGKSRPDREALLNAVAQSGTPEWLPTGNALVSYRASAMEESDAIVLFHWDLANSVAPRHLRLALFSYTVPAAQAESSEVQEQVRLLAHQIRQATFAGELGVPQT
jgi:hypothetical protein